MPKNTAADLDTIHEFLGCSTPKAWVDTALEQQSLLLIDHAHCEKKAASTALNLMYRYVDKTELLLKMSRLAREELRHFEQVLAIMKKRDVFYDHLSPSRYAGELRKLVRTHEPARLVDVLIAGAFIEARSCERFAALAPHLDDELRSFYEGLLASESRHFLDYLTLAKTCAGATSEEIDERVSAFKVLEVKLITEPDSEFRFHSGPPN